MSRANRLLNNFDEAYDEDFLETLKGDVENMLEELEDLERLRSNIEAGLDGLNLQNDKIGKMFYRADSLVDKAIKGYQSFQKSINNI